MMRAALIEPAIFQDQDLVHIFKPNQAMSDEQGCSAAHYIEKRIQYLLLSERVKIGGGLIEDQDRRIFQQHPCDRQPLTFTT